MASEDAVYRESSQFRLWSFSPSQLMTLREQTNALAKTAIEARRVERERAAGVAPTPPPEYLTPAEETLVLDFYTSMLLRAGNHNNQPEAVTSTAAIFLRRFYVTHSVMTYPPSALYKTALFFGAKAEGFYYPLDKFATTFQKKTTPADILAGEFLLCQGIRFAFDVKHPFRALEGAALELRRLADIDTARGGGTNGINGITLPQVEMAVVRAHAILRVSPLMTDAYFFYTPPQIMMAALWLADRGLVDRLLLQETFARPSSLDATPLLPGRANLPTKQRNEAEWERVSGSEVRERVMMAIEECSKMLANEAPERLHDYWDSQAAAEMFTPTMAKMRLCRDPERFDLVGLQQARKQGAVKSYTKAGKGQTNDGSVFGDNLGLVKAGTPVDHDAKRRKTAGGLDDPFGAPL